MDHEDTELPQRRRSHSVDSLLELSPCSSLEDLASGRILQSHQSFIGMVSLQYQAKQVDLLVSQCSTNQGCQQSSETNIQNLFVFLLFIVNVLLVFGITF